MDKEIVALRSETAALRKRVEMLERGIRDGAGCCKCVNDQWGATTLTCDLCKRLEAAEAVCEAVAHHEMTEKIHRTRLYNAEEEPMSGSEFDEACDKVQASWDSMIAALEAWRKVKDETN